jgi:type III pantothenate kinase
MGERYFRTTPLFVTPDTDIRIKVLYYNSVEVGADRVANGVAAVNRYCGPVVVVDLGTTTNFESFQPRANILAA